MADVQAILLIDLSALFWRAWHVTENHGVSYAHSGTVTMVRQLIDRYPDHRAILCLDAPGANWRHELTASLPAERQYKANRDTKDPEAVRMLREVTASLASAGLSTLQAQGYEADDVIATCCRLHDGPIVIGSGDKDLFQLVNDERQVTQDRLDGRVYDAAAVAADKKICVAPSLVRDMLSFAGDKSDNVPGVHRIGPKMAARMLHAYGSAEKVMAVAMSEGVMSSGAIKPGERKLLKDHHDDWKLSLQLVTLKDDTPIANDFGAILKGNPIDTAPASEPDPFARFESVPDAPARTTKTEPEPTRKQKTMSKFTIKKASKKSLKVRVAISGPSGSGKTFTSLKVGKALGPRVLVIDTEHGSAERYAGDFEFETVQLESYAPDELVELLGELDALEQRYDVVIVDSLSHFWAGAGGALEMKDNAAGSEKNKFAAWRHITPMFNRMVEALLGCRSHLIVTLRSKMAYDMEGGKPVRVGLAPVMRDGVEYEFDVCGAMDETNHLSITKTRCSALNGRSYHRPGAEFAKVLSDWASSGDPQAFDRHEAALRAVTDDAGLTAACAAIAADKALMTGSQVQRLREMVGDVKTRLKSSPQNERPVDPDFDGVNMQAMADAYEGVA